MEQLNKLLAQIFLLALLLKSEPHNKALMKMLNEAYVTHNISMEKVDQLVSNIAVSNVVNTYLFDKDSAYVDIESPPINLLRCDWTSIILIHLINPNIN